MPEGPQSWKRSWRNRKWRSIWNWRAARCEQQESTSWRVADEGLCWSGKALTKEGTPEFLTVFTREQTWDSHFDHQRFCLWRASCLFCHHYFIKCLMQVLRKLNVWTLKYTICKLCCFNVNTFLFCLISA